MMPLLPVSWKECTLCRCLLSFFELDDSSILIAAQINELPIPSVVTAASRSQEVIGWKALHCDQTKVRKHDQR